MEYEGKIVEKEGKLLLKICRRVIFINYFSMLHMGAMV